MNGTNITSERVKAKLSQKELASRLGASVALVSRWERGLADPSAKQLVAMRELFGCSIDYLLGQTEERRIA